MVQSQLDLLFFSINVRVEILWKGILEPRCNNRLLRRRRHKERATSLLIYFIAPIKAIKAL
jgi:hypothetical protein